MIETKELVLKLKEAQKERNLTVNNILDLTNNAVSESTIRRVIFTENSENTSFNYEGTIRPLVKALLDVDIIEDSDDMDTKALKSLLKLKIQRIEELEKQISDLRVILSDEKDKSHEKMEKERKQYETHIKLLNEQIILKDKRMDEQAERFNRKDEQYTQLVNRLLNCHCCSKGEQ